MKARKTSAEGNHRKNRTRGQEIWHQFKKNRSGMVGLVICAVVLILAVFAQVYFDYDEVITKVNPSAIFLPSSLEHPFGTDHIGRDVFARVLYGAKYSLFIGLSVTFFAIVVGVTLGSVAAYYGGKTEALIMRTVEMFQMVPAIILAIIIVSVLGISITNLIIALSIGASAAMARVVRAAVLSVRNQEYIESARAIGASDAVIIFKHILPNCLSPIIVAATLRVGTTIVAAATYSFLGLGVPAPIPEWGAMLSDARSYMRSYPGLIIFPGLAIMTTALGINLLGDGLRDALDPKLKR